MMLDELCAELKNYFTKDEDFIFGTHKIEGGTLLSPPSALTDNRFYCIFGSAFNDGVHQYGNTADVLIDETFEGRIGIMSVPPSVISLAEKIESFNETNKPSPFVSESFGGYSYSKSGAEIGWRDVFKNELKRWRKIRI